MNDNSCMKGLNDGIIAPSLNIYVLALRRCKDINNRRFITQKKQYAFLVQLVFIVSQQNALRSNITQHS